MLKKYIVSLDVRSFWLSLPIELSRIVNCTYLLQELLTGILACLNYLAANLPIESG